MKKLLPPPKRKGMIFVLKVNFPKDKEEYKIKLLPKSRRVRKQFFKKGYFLKEEKVYKRRHFLNMCLD